MRALASSLALALSRSELAVLLSLIEVLFGPEWAPRGKVPVPSGLLAGRTGRGAATDLLGLLLMVLTAGSAGWMQLRPGAVDTGRGRPAAAVARLLGCMAEAGAKVLKRLQEDGAADVARQETGSGLHARLRVRPVPVAEPTVWPCGKPATYEPQVEGHETPVQSLSGCGADEKGA
ncbi:hypothetical protein ACFVQ9_05710 [Streptomyces goshikiensis]|uniref:hypothetical protein n=1 Tax=Streptomyces goshikiensis TaxID=1942 RepID=UPI0036BFE149